MNSRQRRQDKKKWPYRVEVVARDHFHYCQMWDWLVAQHGKKVTKCGWRDRQNIYDDDVNFTVRWEFTTERAATEFALRWA